MKKVKILGLSFLATLIVFIDYQFSFLPVWVLFLLILSLYYITTYWILETDIDKNGWYTIVLFPSLMMASVSLALKLYTFPFFHDIHLHISGESLLIFILFFAILTIIGYLLILTMNIFNVSRYKRLPLLQAAQTILYVCTSIGGYVAFNLAYLLFADHISIFLFIIILIGGYLIYINNWGLKLLNDDTISLILIGMFLVAQIGFVLLLLPLRPYIIPLTISITLYIYNGVIIRMKKHRFMNSSWFEYLGLTLLIFILILLTSHWGVAGDILGI